VTRSPITRPLRPALLLALVFCTATAAAQPSPHLRAATIVIDGQPTTVDVHEPGTSDVVGLAIVAHGWTRSREQHRDIGIALAEAGVVAVIPDLPNVVNLWGNGSAIVDLARQLEAGALGLPPILPPSLVLIGTSAGGLATVLAATRLPDIAGWIGLDPVDRMGTGIYAASSLEVPAIVLFGDASACNLAGSARTFARSLPRLVRAKKFEGASHCDFEGPTDGFCQRLCGRAKEETTLAIRAETVLATLELLTAAHAGAGAGDRNGGVPRPAAEAPPPPEPPPE
jgi:pimeloyl-ACP methyl ester carboxylesterase